MALASPGHLSASRLNANPPDFVIVPNASDRTSPQNTFSYNYASSGFGLMPLYYPVDA